MRRLLKKFHKKTATTQEGMVELLRRWYGSPADFQTNLNRMIREDAGRRTPGSQRRFEALTALAATYAKAEHMGVDITEGMNPELVPYVRIIRTVLGKRVDLERIKVDGR